MNSTYRLGRNQSLLIGRNLEVRIWHLSGCTKPNRLTLAVLGPQRVSVLRLEKFEAGAEPNSSYSEKVRCMKVVRDVGRGLLLGDDLEIRVQAVSLADQSAEVALSSPNEPAIQLSERRMYTRDSVGVWSRGIYFRSNYPPSSHVRNRYPTRR